MIHSDIKEIYYGYDFGIEKIEKKNNPKETRGTPDYISPEVI